ncbi:DUF2305 domain-containing protein, partial [Cephalotus follicularis]
MNFIRQELEDLHLPILLVGHSIGSYISLEMLKSCPEKVVYFVGLYPFLAVNMQSEYQSAIRKIAESPVLSATISVLAASLGLLPSWALKLIVKYSLGKSWSTSAVEATCTSLLQYHSVRNVLYMTMTEFREV